MNGKQRVKVLVEPILVGDVLKTGYDTRDSIRCIQGLPADAKLVAASLTNGYLVLEFEGEAMPNSPFAPTFQSYRPGEEAIA